VPTPERSEGAVSAVGQPQPAKNTIGQRGRAWWYQYGESWNRLTIRASTSSTSQRFSCPTCHSKLALGANIAQPTVSISKPKGHGKQSRLQKAAALAVLTHHTFPACYQRSSYCTRHSPTWPRSPRRRSTVSWTEKMRKLFTLVFRSSGEITVKRK